MTSAPLNPSAGPARRTIMAAAGAAGLTAALTACGSSNDSSSSTTTNNAGGGTALAKTSDIPEGGGTIFKDQAVVVTQPTSGTYKAFATKCPHAGCPVTSVANGAIVCPCHGSQFSIADGSVKHGPATTGLTAANITVSGDQITLA
ncbi:Rieske (2Fe-2S) protein [Streptomyces sp. NPDC005917]|uniref:Rieske (2Fe-2S) protein n=1 Tax=unclassified Streptomyces TaxID=2593676 RepID=UPI0033DF7774